MSIKKILAFVLLLLLIYIGVYVAIYGTILYTLYSGSERNFNNMSAGELQPKLNVKGDVETVTKMLYSEHVTSDILGIPVGSANRYYYVMPIGYQEDPKQQQYCVIAVSDPDNVAAIDKLMKNGPVPRDPNAPRFEFRGIALDMSTKVYAKFEDYLHEIYFVNANVSHNLVPYIIFVKGEIDDNFLPPIIAGGACAVIGAVLFILLAVKTYKRKHMYN